MPKSIDDYLKEPYSRILIPDENGFYSAEILEFTGCFAEGPTADEAIYNLEEAAKSWIEASLEQGQEIPEPMLNQGFGGKIALRLPKSLHRQAVRMAELDGVSLNQFLVSAIAERVGAEDFYTRLGDRFEQKLLSTATGIYIKSLFGNIPIVITPSLTSANTKAVQLPLEGLIDNKTPNTMET